ncbi:MAG: hypothetical protein JWO02_3604 [Solirubrobacterales bacterium]|nr:hypothetical protein [Solirubrobacterales bacterium]
MLRIERFASKARQTGSWCVASIARSQSLDSPMYITNMRAAGRVSDTRRVMFQATFANERFVTDQGGGDVRWS